MTVLVADDDAAVMETLEHVLRPLGHSVDGCGSAEEVLELIQTKAYTVIVVARGLPGLNGVSLCRELKRRGVRSGLLMLSSRESQSEKLEAFEARVDDYLVKPCDAGELGARIDGLARRIRELQATLVRSGSIAIDEYQGMAYIGSQRTPLTRLELHLLKEFVRQPGQVLSRQELLDRIWGIRWNPHSNLVQVHVHNLREKLGGAGARLITVRDEGYKLDP